MIIVTLRIVVPPERRGDVLKTIRLLLGPTQVQPGCKNSRFYQEIENSNALFLIEEWKSQADLDRHISSDEYRKILALMDISSESPEIKFNTILHTAGMEALKTAREKSINHQNNKGEKF